MVLTTALASLVLGIAAQTPLSCPVMGSPVNEKSPAVDYAGVRYAFCCPGCDTQFASEPQKFIASEKNKGKILGTALFDPVSRGRVEAKTAKGGSSDFEGTRFLFLKAENKKAFDAEPKKYAKAPAKESLFCPVTGEVVESAAKAPAFVDHEGVRYYFCCAGCIGGFKGAVNKEAAAKAAAPKAAKVAKS